MMNRSTQKELIKLMLQLNEMWPQLDLSNSEQQNMVLDILNTVSTKCQKDFSKANAGRYADIMESLGLVIKMTDWHNMGREELTQCISLCQDIILQVINNLRNEKEIKKDIVFLPYKASMWDSLESVWKAAYEDKEHCNAYVIPIPYADLNPDRSIAKWHCEREQFPKYVPTLDWQEIDLEKWHPDIIFIHNPYDNYNYITSVESRYYAQNLKHCTNKLVYIPYFVLEEPCTEESVEHFVLTAGVLNADKVIVQSEAMRELYINILTKKTEQKDRAYWENRISGAGSPKIEKVLTSKKEDFEMPEKWRTMVEGKKIILYNTSLSAMLQNSNKVCDKLRCVFDIFRKRDDVVLWWRPHPLMKSTFHSMRPQYEEEYFRLEKQYIEEGWGIYDDSSDLHRAICWSDAYYGDVSSVVKLYRMTRKPVGFVKWSWHIRNIDIHETYGYTVDASGSVIYRIHLESGEIKSIGYIPNEYISTEYPYGMLCKVGEKLIILPEQERRILEYDTIKRVFREITVLKRQYSISKWSTFLSYIKTNDSIYFISHHQGEIIKYDLQHQKYISLEKYRNKINAMLSAAEHKNVVNRGWLGYAYRHNDTIFIPVVHTNKILCLNIKNDDVKIYTVKGVNSIQDMSWDENFFYFLQLDGKVFRCRYREGQGWIHGQEYSFHVRGSEKYSYYFIACSDNKLILYPGECGDVTVLDGSNGRVRERRHTDQVWMCCQKNSVGKYSDFTSGSSGNFIHIVQDEKLKTIKIPNPTMDDIKRDIDRLIHDSRNRESKKRGENSGFRIYEMLCNDWN